MVHSSHQSGKDATIANELSSIIRYMPDVRGCRDELENLGSQWDLLTTLGQMSGNGTDMTTTREGFEQLTAELINQLAEETLNKTVQAAKKKAQVCVDIVIRNLFERTADIGFLATDDDIREFLIAIEQDDARIDEQRRQHVVERFQEYVAKYSVYFDIVLLDTEGNVVVRLDQTLDVKKSTDPLLVQALTTNSEYVETFRATDLLPDAGNSLVYAFRVTTTNEADSKPLGVLALCFRFENEMDGIFANLSTKDDWTVLTLLDKNGMVIASSDKYHIPVGAPLEMVLDADYRIVRFGGREYLATTRRTNGYEGFMGLGWHGHVLLPLDHAYEKGGASGDLSQRVDEKILLAVMSDPRLFSSELRSIPLQADRIQAELERTVWNGNVRQSDTQAKVLLWKISGAGAQTKTVFEHSIGNLHQTVISGILADVEFQAALAVDIMDRNLYERANDCRWWALTSAFRQLLSRQELSTEDGNTIADILAYINDLYTVYTNLFVYNDKGKVVAVSNPDESHLVGSCLGQDWARQTLSLQDSQKYAVSPFQSTGLYGSRHTYVYGAAITDPHNPRKTVGGIGIVFDSEPQFAAMLEDSLPRDASGSVSEGCFGIFADRNRMIISSTDEDHKVGSILEIDQELFSLPKGRKDSRIIAYHGQYYAIGACTSAGYREYKRGDGYENDVVGLVFVPLAEVRDIAIKTGVNRNIGVRNTHTGNQGENCIEVASFYINGHWLGLETDNVVEAIKARDVTAIPGANSFILGKVMYDGDCITVIDIYEEFHVAAPKNMEEAQIIVFNCDVNGRNQRLGLLVDRLGEIPEICMSRVETVDAVFEQGKGYVESVIKPDMGSGNNEILVVLNPQGLMAHLAQVSNKRVGNSS